MSFQQTFYESATGLECKDGLILPKSPA